MSERFKRPFGLGFGEDKEWCMVVFENIATKWSDTGGRKRRWTHW